MGPLSHRLGGQFLGDSLQADDAIGAKLLDVPGELEVEHGRGGRRDALGGVEVGQPQHRRVEGYLPETRAIHAEKLHEPGEPALDLRIHLPRGHGHECSRQLRTELLEGELPAQRILRIAFSMERPTAMRGRHTARPWRHSPSVEDTAPII
jgi:hypothetical protein